MKWTGVRQIGQNCCARPEISGQRREFVQNNHNWQHWRIGQTQKIRDKSHHSLRKCHQVTSHLQQSSLTCHLTFNSIKFHLNTFGSVHGLEHSGGHFEMVQIRNIFGATARECPSKLEGEKMLNAHFLVLFGSFNETKNSVSLFL